MQRYRLRALFSGSHDDTLVALSGTSEGSVLTCDTGSTTRLSGEDGEVQLTCLFSTNRASVVDMTLLHRHAQFVGVVLEAF